MIKRLLLYIGKVFKKLSIANKFIVSLLILLIIPLLGIFMWINSNVYQQIYDQNCQKNLEILKQTKSPIKFLVQDMIFVSLEILGNIKLQEYIIDYSSSSSLDKERMCIQIYLELNNLISSRESISRVSIINEEELFFQFGNYLLLESSYPFDEVKKLKGNILWLPAFFEKNYVSIVHGANEIGILRAINDLNYLNKVIAYERINIFESELTKLYAGSGNTETKAIFIINDKGDVISSTDKNMLETSIKNECYFDKLNKNNEGYFPVDDTIISFYKFKDVNWTIVQIDDLASVTGENITELIIWVSILLTLLFGVLFYIIQQRYIIKPVIEIKKDVGRIKNSQYDFNLHTTSEDEIADLNNSLILMGKNMQGMIAQEADLRVSEKESQLQYLQSQINPHFLYNTLESIRWMAIKVKNENLANQINNLANHFRHALNGGRDMTTVKEEIKHIEGYLMIQKNRFGERLHVKIEKDDNLNNYPVLNLILQPLVENSIVHGLERKLGDWFVEIKIYKKDKCIVYSVKDNGMGIDEDYIKEKMKPDYAGKDALALNNVNKRLKYKYGEEYGLQFNSEIGIGTTIVIKFPILEEDKS